LCESYIPKIYWYQLAKSEKIGELHVESCRLDLSISGENLCVIKPHGLLYFDGHVYDDDVDSRLNSPHCMIEVIKRVLLSHPDFCSWFRGGVKFKGW